MHQRQVRERQGKAALGLVLDSSITHREHIKHDEDLCRVFIKVLVLPGSKLGMWLV